MDKKQNEAINERIIAAKKKREAEIAARKKREAEAKEAVAITASLINPNIQIEDLTKIALSIITDWEHSNASTIRESDINDLMKISPSFGVLEENNGRKIYAFFEMQGGHILKKRVVPFSSGAFQDKDGIIPLIEKYFALMPIHRRKK